MKLLISGLCGHMGNEVAKLAMAGCRGAEFSGSVGVDINACGSEGIPCAHNFTEASADAAIYTNIDCIVDFSHHSLTRDLLDFAIKYNLPVVLATTGHTDEEKAYIRTASESIPVFFAANFSLGVALLIDTARRVAAAMPDAEIEIIEKHHNRKVDAPSGTALMLFNAIKEVRPEATANCGRAGEGKRTKEEIGISALRMGSVVGVHEVHIHTGTQHLTLKHEAVTRAMLADGAVAAARFMEGKGKGLYNMENMLN